MVSGAGFILSVVGAVLGVRPMENESTVGTEYGLNPWKHLCSLGTHAPATQEADRSDEQGAENEFCFGWQRENSKCSQFWFWSTPLARQCWLDCGQCWHKRW